MEGCIMRGPALWGCYKKLGMPLAEEGLPQTTLGAVCSLQQAGSAVLKDCPSRVNSAAASLKQP